MQAVVGPDAPFGHGREQMKILAGREVPTPAVEPMAEASGDDIARGQPEEVQRGVELDWPIVIGALSSYPVRANGRHRGAGRKETDRGAQSQADGQPAPTREAKLGCVFTQTAWDEEGFAIRDPDST